MADVQGKVQLREHFLCQFIQFMVVGSFFLSFFLVLSFCCCYKRELYSKMGASFLSTPFRDTKFRGLRLHFTPPGLSLGTKTFIYTTRQLKPLLCKGVQLDNFKILHMNIDQRVGILELEMIL